jgi:PIN like domain
MAKKHSRKRSQPEPASSAHQAITRQLPARPTSSAAALPVTYPVGPKRESVEDFTARVEPLLRDASTVIYMDTSFAMWLVKGSLETRKQFIEWAKGLDGRIHVPVWTFHEFYRHHQHDTLRADVASAARTLKNAANDFVEAAKLFADQPLYGGLSEEHFLRELELMKVKVGEVIGATQSWKYGDAAAHIASWLSEHLCQSRIVFDLMATLGQVGSNRFTQDVPPGFLDRVKEDSKEKGSNRFGDLILWEEVLAHVPATQATTVILLTKDRKFDWFAKSEDPDIATDMKWIRSRWDPVPAPHPMLVLELTQRSSARQLVLLDNLYLGSILWSVDPRKYSKLVAYALGMTLGTYEERRPADQRQDEPVVKRPISTAPTLAQIKTACDAALDPTSPTAQAMLAQILQKPNDAEAFLATITGESLAAMAIGDRASLARLVADSALMPENPTAKLLAETLLRLATTEKAETAAPIYIGLLASAYFDGPDPRDIPRAVNLQGIFDHIADGAFDRARLIFGRRLAQSGSRALFIPQREAKPLVLRFVHDADQLQVPLVLVQILLFAKGLLSEVGPGLPSNLCRALHGKTSASVESLSKIVAHRYGLPEKLLTIEGADPTEMRTIPSDLGFLEIDAILANEQDSADDEMETEPLEDFGALNVDDAAESTLLDGDNE